MTRQAPSPGEVEYSGAHQSSTRSGRDGPSHRPLPAFLQASTAEAPPVSQVAHKPRSPFLIDLLIAGALAAATFLLYLPSLANDFVLFDDPDYLTNVPIVKQGLTPHGIIWAITQGSTTDWLPLTYLSNMGAVSLFGMSPAWHHAVNMALHALNAALVFIFLRSLIGRRWPAAIVAALFAFHPLRVESVAWVSGRKDVLCGAFFLLALLAYTQYVRRPGVLRYSLVVIWFAAALCSKSEAVALPPLLLLLDLGPLQRGRGMWRTLVEKLPLFLMVVADSIITVAVQQRGHAMKALGYWSTAARAANAAVSVARYLGKTIWPANLSAFYPHPDSWPAWAVIGSILMIAAVTLLAVSLRKRMPLVIVGWLWFLGLLVPVCGIVPVGLFSMADRYTYLPSIGLFMAVVCAGDRIAGTSLKARKAAIALVVVALTGLATATWMRQAVWRNTLDLFQDALAVDEQNWKAHDFLGAQLLIQGETDRAMAHFQRANELNRQHPLPIIHMGIVFRRFKQNDQALALFREAVDLAPDISVTHEWLAIGLSTRADYAGADREFALASRLDAQDMGITVNWALSMANRGQLDRARDMLHAVFDRDPGNALAGDLLRKLNSRGSGLQQPSTSPATSVEPK